MNNLKMNIGIVREVENTFSKDGYDGLRVRVELDSDKQKRIASLPWAFSLLPKTFQSIPKVGEAVFVLMIGEDNKSAQRFFIGPIISQPQYHTYASKKNATTLLTSNDRNPIEKISNVDDTRGAFPNAEDVAVIGRGSEDVILRYDTDSKASEVDLRAGVRGTPTNSDNKNLIGNIIFNGTDPAYIQLKYKKGLATKANNEANSVINMVANRINIMSNKDTAISHNLQDKETLVNEEKMDEIMDNLHQVPMGDKLVELLEIMRGSIMNHVHPWAGMEQCGDWTGYIKQLQDYPIDTILSKYVRIS